MLRTSSCALSSVIVFGAWVGCGSQPTVEEAASAEIVFTGEVDDDLAKIDETLAAGPFTADWDSLAGNGVADWYRDAKLGIFIHWGVYAVPAFGNEWYPRRMYLNEIDRRRNVNVFEHHLATWGPQKTFGYKDFIPMFTVENYDPEAWAALFEEAGARYVVPVGEHHDGFPLYASSHTRWDASEMGPKRDVIAALERAVRARGMKFGVSSHRAFNHGYYARDESYDTVDEEGLGLYGEPREDLEFTSGQNLDWFPQSEAFRDDWLARTAEMAEKFKADLIWFDFGIGPRQKVTTWQENPFAPHLKRFMAYYYNRARAWGKTGVVNYKFEAMPENVGVLDLERARLAGMRDLYWQTDTSVGFTSWGYVTNHRYKDVRLILTEFVDIVSKNGCLLLNIGPRADGTIPEREAEILRKIGGWLEINGEAIYGSRPWKIYGEGPTETVEGHLSEERNRPMGPEDIRFTTKGETLYATALGLADSEWTIESLRADSEHLDGHAVSKVRLLGHDADLEWSQGPDALVIRRPALGSDRYAYVFEVTLEQ
ncbi:MAG: alpha-L-fucosidase [Bryobacterales bacterium]|nr:alpha-L-fucosidase [Bryobacterales bacterium]